MSQNITNNQRPTLNVIDSVSKAPFAVKGISADGSVNVNITSATVSGSLTNNNAAPGATNIGVLPAIANVAAPTYSEGKQVLLSTDLAGQLRVTGSLSVGGTTDNSAFTAGTSTGTPAMGFYHSVLDTVTDGRAATVAITPKRAMMVNLQTAAGVETGIAAAPLQVSLANTAANGTAIKVDGTGGTFPISGTVTTTPPPNASTNIAQINAVTPLMGNGLTGTGSLRVTIASDNTAFAVNSTLSAETTKVIGTVNIAASQTIAVTNTGTFATQSTLAAETTKVIGTVRNGDGAGNLWTSNSTTYTAKFAQDANLLGTLGTAFSTAGKVDVKAADGDVFVRQATGTNLHTVLDSGTLTGITNSVTVTATNLSTNTAQINGVTPLMGNGASGTGAQRVTLASDSTGQVAPAANATATGTAIYNNTALSSTKQAVNAAAGNLYGYHIYNPNSVVIYIQMWNIASASVTVGTTAPTCVIAVPAGGWADAPPSGPPITFGTALTVAATTTATGSGAPATALLCNIWFK